MRAIKLLLCDFTSGLPHLLAVPFIFDKGGNRSGKLVGASGSHVNAKPV